MADKPNVLDHLSTPRLKSGQTTDYTPAGRTTKDDGGFQRGVTGSKLDAAYEILTTGQYAGTTAITVNGKTDTHSNECVYDKNSTLMWSRTLSAFVFGDGSEQLYWDDTGGSDEDIFEYCDQANLASLSGFNDWRVPNLMELYSLTIIETPGGLPNSTAFPTTWLNVAQHSSTTNPGNTSQVILMSYIDGTSFATSKTGARLPTALVRLGSVKT